MLCVFAAGLGHSLTGCSVCVSTLTNTDLALVNCVSPTLTSTGGWIGELLRGGVVGLEACGEITDTLKTGAMWLH